MGMCQPIPSCHAYKHVRENTTHMNVALSEVHVALLQKPHM